MSETPPPSIDPQHLAQSLAMSADISDKMRFELIEMLHELAARRRVHPWPGAAS